jgi:Sulfotransferase family
MSDQFDTMFDIPTYQTWLERQDMRPAYAYHRQFLQHLTVMRSAFSDFVDPAAIGSEMVRFWKATLDGFLDDRKKLPSGAVYDVRFTDLISDPIAVIGELYRELGHEFTAEAEGRMRSFLLRHPNGRYGNHSYAMASFGLDPVEVHLGFTLYRERFGLQKIAGLLLQCRNSRSTDRWRRGGHTPCAQRKVDAKESS